MAPHSDVDIGFVTPFKQTSWTEQVIEAQLYTLWDLGLKVGNSSRSVDEMISAAKDDLTIRTAMVEIGRAQVGTPVNNAQLVCRLLLEKKKNQTNIKDEINNSRRLTE